MTSWYSSPELRETMRSSRPHRIRVGAVTLEGSECTGALPGNLFRSYEMVE